MFIRAKERGNPIAKDAIDLIDGSNNDGSDKYLLRPWLIYFTEKVWIMTSVITS